MPDKHNDTFDTGEYNWNGEVNPSASSPNFGKLTTTSFSTISRGFTDAIKWLKSEPKDDFTTDEIEQVEQAMKALIGKNLADAIKIMEKVREQQELRRSQGIRRRIVRFVWRRRSPTMVPTLLASLLNARTVERINGAGEKLRRSSKDDIVKILQYGIPDNVMKYLRGGGHASRSGETCSFCSCPAVGELKQEDGKSWKLCSGHSAVAQGALSDRKQALQKFADVLDKERQHMERAHALNPKDPTISKNLDYVRKTLAELSSRITPTETRKHLHVKTGKRSARIIPWITSFLREYVLPFMIIGALLGIIYVVTHIPWWISVIAGGAIGIGLGIWALVRYVSAASPFLDFYKKKW